MFNESVSNCNRKGSVQVIGVNVVVEASESVVQMTKDFAIQWEEGRVHVAVLVGKDVLKNGHLTNPFFVIVRVVASAKHTNPVKHRQVCGNCYVLS